MKGITDFPRSPTNLNKIKIHEGGLLRLSGTVPGPRSLVVIISFAKAPEDRMKGVCEVGVSTPFVSPKPQRFMNIKWNLCTDYAPLLTRGICGKQPIQKIDRKV